MLALFSKSIYTLICQKYVSLLAKEIYLTKRSSLPLPEERRADADVPLDREGDGSER
jgi:hypothetical protein